MGRNAAFSQEQVFEAADKLASNNQEVTPNALRDLLGRGSYSTFVKHIDTWQQARRAAPAPVVLAMPESVKVAFDQCWTAAAGEAGKEINVIREKADAEIKATKRRLDETMGVIEQLEGEAEADTAKLETAEAALTTERAASQQAVTDAAAREAGLAATAAQMHQQIEAQQSELARVHAEADAARNQHAAEITRLTADFSRQTAEQASTLQSVQGETDRLRKQLAEAGEKIEAISARERSKIEEATAAKAEVTRLTTNFNEQTGRNFEIISKLEKLQKIMNSDLDSARRETHSLESRLERATGELEALRTQVAGQTDVIKGFASTQTDQKLK